MNETPDHERAVSPVASPRRLFRSEARRKAAFGAAALAAAGLLASGVYSMSNDKGPAQKPIDTGSTTIAQTVPDPQNTPPAQAEPAQKKEAPPERIVYVPAPPEKQPAIVAAAAPDNFVRFPASVGETFFDVPAPPAREDKPQGGASGANAKADAATQVAFKPSILIGGKAGPALRLTYLMMPQHIPCALDTAMDSTLAGSITCHTTQEVRSPDHIMLMPVGTQITGTYKNDVRNGQHRLFAFAGNAITKEGIPVPLDSGVSDSLGRTGIEGDVDSHLMERFGAAIALTGAQSAMSLAQAMVSKGGNNYLNLNSGGGADTIASDILRSQIGIPPTISVPPGSIISIVVDHPIDFSEALHVEAR